MTRKSLKEDVLQCIGQRKASWELEMRPPIEQRECWEMFKTTKLDF